MKPTHQPPPPGTPSVDPFAGRITPTVTDSPSPVDVSDLLHQLLRVSGGTVGVGDAVDPADPGGSVSPPRPVGWEVLPPKYTGIRLCDAIQGLWAATPGPRRGDLAQIWRSDVVPPVPRAEGGYRAMATLATRYLEWTTPEAIGALARLWYRAGDSPGAVLIPLTPKYPKVAMPTAVIQVILTHPPSPSAYLEAYLEAVAEVTRGDAGALPPGGLAKRQAALLRRCLSHKFPPEIREYLQATYPDEVRDLLALADSIPPAPAPAKTYNLNPNGLGQWVSKFQADLAAGKVARAQHRGMVQTQYAAMYASYVRGVIRHYEQHDQSAAAVAEHLGAPGRRHVRYAWGLFVHWAHATGQQIPPGVYPTAQPARLSGEPPATTPDIVEPKVPKKRSPLATGKDFPALPELGLRPCHTVLSAWNGAVLTPSEVQLLDPSASSPGRLNKRRPVPATERAAAMALVHQMLQGSLPPIPVLERPGPWARAVMAFAVWAEGAEGYAETTALHMAREVAVLLDDFEGFLPEPARGHPFVTGLLLDQISSKTRVYVRWVWNKFSAFAQEVQAPWAWLFPRLRPYGVRPLTAMPKVVRQAIAWLILWKRLPVQGEKLPQLRDRFKGILTLEAIRGLTPRNIICDANRVPRSVQIQSESNSKLDVYTHIEIGPQEQPYFNTLLVWRAGFPGTVFDPTKLDRWPYPPLSEDHPLLVPYPGVPVPLRINFLREIARDAIHQQEGEAIRLRRLGLG